jgi:hypothetical protein
VHEAVTDLVRAYVSADGRWWWDGRQWIAAESADGLWRWDGAEWRAAVSIDDEDPVQLSCYLAEMADVRYLEAGTLLARRRRQWCTPDELAPLVDEAYFKLRRLDAIEARLIAIETQVSRAGSSILALLSGAVGERRQLIADRERSRQQLRSRLIELGEGAHQPTTKEADDVLTSAQVLRERAIAVSSAMAAVVAAEQNHEADLAVAEADLLRTEQGRVEAIREAEQEIDKAHAAQREAIETARQELASASVGEAGEPVAHFQQVQLSEYWIETPDGRGPAEGARAFLDTAPAIWKAQQPLLSRMLEVDSTGARTFHVAESSGHPDLFLVIATDLVKSVVHCPVEEMDAARHFALEVARVSDRLLAARPQQDASVGAMRAELQARLTDGSGVEQAQAHLAAVKAEKGLLGAVISARQRVDQIRADDSQVRLAQERVHDLIDELATPPDPLS